MSDETAVRSYIDDAMERHSKIDCLLNIAGVNGPLGPTHELDTAEVRQLFDINYFSFFFITISKNVVTRRIPKR